jgi:hypothetical protein
MAPAVITANAPAHLLGREAIYFVFACHGGVSIGIAGRRKSVVFRQMRRQRRGLRARGERSRARGKSKGEFQKMAAFHDVCLLMRIP